MFFDRVVSSLYLKKFEIKNTFLISVPTIGVRHVQALLMFFYMVVTLLTRSTMSIAVVAMTNYNSTTSPDVPVSKA